MLSAHLLSCDLPRCVQAELQKRNLDTKWDPLRGGKKVLEERLQV